MDVALLLRHFERVGARAKVQPNHTRLGHLTSDLRVDVLRDARGEFFDLRMNVGAEPLVEVVDLEPRMRHLLLLARDHSTGSEEKHKFLCGHDERHWFVAAIPERETVSSVRTAFEALKPRPVRRLQDQLKINPRRRNRRRNAAFIRQGEWFFVPARGWFRPDPKMIFRNEPISRGRGKPHRCEQLVRTGGEAVYVSTQHPMGLTQDQYERLISRRPAMRRLGWIVQRRNPLVFVRGKIRHADHKTIDLRDWHRVLMNTEHEAVAMRHVAFID